MKLNNLKIRNFRGLESLELNPEGESLIVYGRNAIKKSTAGHAYAWLMTNKDMFGRSPLSFTIKPREVLENGELGDEIIGLEPMVEGVFDLGTRKITLKKEHLEKWVPNHGEVGHRHDGYTTQHYIDNEKVSAGDYNSALAEIIDPDLVQQLSNPLFIAESMKKKDCRALLMKLVDIDDTDVIDSHPVELKGYLEILDGKKHDSVKNVLSDRLTFLTKELGAPKKPGEISARIDENLLKKVKVDQGKASIQSEIEAIQQAKADRLQEIVVIKAGGGVAELRIQYQNIEAEKATYLNKAQAEADNVLSSAREKVSELASMVDESGEAQRQATLAHALAERDFNNAREGLQEIQERIAKERSTAPKDLVIPDADPGVCYACKRPLEAEQDDTDYEADHKRYVAEFNAAKAERIKTLQAQFDKAEAILESLSAMLLEKVHDGLKAKGKNDQRKDAHSKALAHLEELKAKVPSPDTSEFDSRQSEIQKKILDLETTTASTISSLTLENSMDDRAIKDREELLRIIKNNEELQARIDELSDLKQVYGKEKVQVETKLHLLEKFTRTKSMMLQDEINKKFEHVSWRLFRDQQNGGLEERCDPVYNSQLWLDLSTSEQIKCGLDIINTISGFYGKQIPAWLDNRESTTEIPDNDIQTISLMVSPSDAVLRVEIEPKRNVAAA